ncbi:lipase/esterase-like protein [Talaromyces proteolyticus]|uniref:Lipase/esterase-like protein n=1 Tax=Talaromyces proteolyticus TaxID=1131652 RepID=A0AAD4KRG2_9EURO|nr:lipase/esterase-like protein [Talaromyces proteolyticus]KAH8695376.1 lipase/esterase-like protein [Talaromyces proteolyticus]
MGPSLAEEWLQVEEKIGYRPRLTGDVLDMREQYKALSGQGIASKVNKVSVENKYITPYLLIRLYTPTEKGTDLRPVGVYFHGGGFCCGDLDSEDGFCSILAERFCCIVASVNYRLAPEHKSPVQLEDAVEAWTWAYENAPILGGDRTKYFTIGQSAGGTLALATVNRLIALGRKSEAKGVAALVPFVIHPQNVPLSYADKYTSFHECADGPVNTASAMNIFFEAAETNPNDPDIFLIHSEHLDNFPPTYIAVCEADPLRDDGIILREVLKRAGIPVKLDHFKSLPHVFWAFDCPAPSGDFLGDVMSGISFIMGQ